MNTPFSVLMAVYKNDRVDHFMLSVESVMSQNPAPDDLVIVRDGPVPSEIQLALDGLKKTYPGVVNVVELASNVGLSAALNCGLAQCRHDLVARQDADDVSEPFRFSRQLALFSNDPQLALASAWQEQYSFDLSHVVSVRKVPEHDEEIVKFGRNRTPFNHACAVFRKSVVLEVGGYPTIKGLCEDWWLALRLIKHGKKMYNLQESLVKWRGGDDFFNRRRGMSYIKQEIVNQTGMYKEGLLSLFDVAKNLMIRVPLRLIPSSLLSPVYRHLIRKKS